MGSINQTRNKKKRTIQIFKGFQPKLAIWLYFGGRLPRSSHNFMENKSTPKNYLWNQESDVLLNPVLERSHQEKMISEI